MGHRSKIIDSSMSLPCYTCRQARSRSTRTAQNGGLHFLHAPLYGGGHPQRWVPGIDMATPPSATIRKVDIARIHWQDCWAAPYSQGWHTKISFCLVTTLIPSATAHSRSDLRSLLLHFSTHDTTSSRRTGCSFDSWTATDSAPFGRSIRACEGHEVLRERAAATRKKQNLGRIPARTDRPSMLSARCLNGPSVRTATSKSQEHHLNVPHCSPGSASPHSTTLGVLNASACIRLSLIRQAP